MVNEEIASSVVTNHIRLLQLSAQERREAIRILRLLERDLLAQIEAFPDPAAGTIRESRVKSLRRAVRKILATHYDTLRRKHARVLDGVVQDQNTRIPRIINAAMTVEAATRSLSQEVLQQLVKSDIVGAPASEWWSRQSQKLQRDFMDQMRLGILAKESRGDLLRRVRGTRALRYKDGLMEVSRRQADALIRTSVLSVANASRAAVYREHRDVIKGHTALVTLDNRTSTICIARSGGAWDIQTGDPLPESNTSEAFPGYPPWHFNCRTVLTPILKSFNELLGAKGSRFDQALGKLGPGTRASINGQVPGRMTFEDWLGRRPKKEREKILGKGKLRLWESGKIELPQLIDQRGNPLTLRELQALYE